MKPESIAEKALVTENIEQKIATEAGKVDLKVTELEAKYDALLVEVKKKEQVIQGLNEKLIKSENRAARSGLTDESREFRLFMEVVNGFVGRGMLDPSTLAVAIKTNPANRTPEHTLLAHAAGLAAVANKAARDKGF